MGRHRKWENEEMWQQAVVWNKGGLTYRDIAGRLSKSENMKKFGLAVAPGEDTVRRELARRLSVDKRMRPYASRHVPSDLESGKGRLEVARDERADPELGPHRRELFYFGRGLRDLVALPSAHEVVKVTREEFERRMWSGWTSPLVASLRDAEEEEVASQWDFFGCPAQKHPLFPAFGQHLGEYECWESLGRIEEAFRVYGEGCRHAYQAISKEVHERQPGISEGDAQAAAMSLLVDGLNRKRGGPGLTFDYEPHMEGDAGYRLRFGAWMTRLVDNPAGLQILAAVHQDLRKGPPLEAEFEALAEAERTAHEAITEFQQALSPDALLRKLLLNGRCDWCP